MGLLGILFALLMTGSFTDGANILAIFPYQGKSHNIMFEPLMIGLAKAGHSVDVVSHFPLENPVTGFNHTSLKGTLRSYVNEVPVEITLKNKGIFRVIHFASAEEPKSLCGLMKLPQLQDIINTDKKYDLMITEIMGTNCYLAVAHKLKLPVVGLVTNVMYSWAYPPVFGDTHPSFIPSQLTEFTNEMNFVERVQNLIIHLYSQYLFSYYDRTLSDPLARKYVEGVPPLNDIYNNISLVICNSHFSIHGARPGNPAVVEAAGIHIDESQILSEELDSFLNSSKDGVVYFSMGTMVRSDTFSPEKIHAIYETFSELSNYKVLWKGNLDSLPEPLPYNVKVVSWAPQYAVLKRLTIKDRCGEDYNPRHPKVKAFVTHGGLMGTQEAIHAGVPMIGIPFFSDQKFNVKGYAHRGFAIYLDYLKISKESFSKALAEVLTNPKYQSNAARFSRLFKDRPLSPLDEAIFWIEYVIRNGGESLKSSGRHLYWFQYYLIDVILFLLAVTSLIIAVLFTFVRRTLRIITGTQTFSDPMKQKTS